MTFSWLSLAMSCRLKGPGRSKRREEEEEEEEEESGE